MASLGRADAEVGGALARRARRAGRAGRAGRSCIVAFLLFVVCLCGWVSGWVSGCSFTVWLCMFGRPRAWC